METASSTTSASTHAPSKFKYFPASDRAEADTIAQMAANPRRLFPFFP